MTRTLWNIIWTGLFWLLAIIVGTIFRLEIEDFWNGKAQPFIEANMWAWVATMLDYLPTFWGGAAATLLIMLLVDRARYWIRRKKPQTVLPDGISKIEATPDQIADIVKQIRLTTKELRLKGDKEALKLIKQLEQIEQKVPALQEAAKEDGRELANDLDDLLAEGVSKRNQIKLPKALGQDFSIADYQAAWETMKEWNDRVLLKLDHELVSVRWKSNFRTLDQFPATIDMNNPTRSHIRSIWDEKLKWLRFIIHNIET